MNPFDQATPGFNHRIPDKILTPDNVETSVGTLEFFDGIPSADTLSTCLLYTSPSPRD